MSVKDSPVVLSSYDPRGQYLAAVTITLDKQRISVESTSPSSTSQINENFLYLDDSNLRVSSIEWSYLSSTETLCVLIGLNNGEIWIYSPLSNEIIYKLSTGNAYEIRDLQVNSTMLWCIDSSDTFYEFSLNEFKLKQHFTIESCVQLNKLSIISSNENQLLVASHSIFLVDTVKREVILTFPGHISPVCILKLLSNDFFLSGAVNDRFLNVYDINTGLTKSVLVAQSNVHRISNSGQDSIAVSTEDGKIEIFEDPLVSNTNKRRGNKSKQANKTIQVVSEKNLQIPLFNVFINRDILNITWLQNATIPLFAQLQWKELPTEYSHTVSLGHGTKNVAKDYSLHGKDLAAATNYSEGNARISSGDNFKHVTDLIKELELKSEQNEREGNEAVSESLADKLEAVSLSRLNGKKSKDSKTAMTPGTFTVVLSQALQSNDHSLLETVLNNRDERVIKDTVIRLKPTRAVILLERLAERIARQTHRQGPLNIWVKWCLIIHGGYLVTVPNLMSTLSSLHSTLKRRAELLPRLLTLETKLEYTLNSIELKQDTTVNELQLEETIVDDEDENDVEYNEELDDAGLIEDGEEDFYSDEDSEEGETEDEDSNRPNSNANEDVEMEDDDEEGYSDVEM